MDNEHEVAPADMTWPDATRIERVREVAFTDTETGETFKFLASDYEAQTAGTFTAHWDANGVIAFDLAEVGFETGPTLAPADPDES